MANLQGFDANQVEPLVPFQPLPAGKYLAVIAASEMKSNKAHTGEYLQLTFQVVEGSHQGRQVWTRLNLVNPNAQAVQIAKAELSAICRAVGVATPHDSVELHHIPLEITVTTRLRNDTGETTNEIKAYAKRETGPANVTATAVTGPAASLPWKRPVMTPVATAAPAPPPEANAATTNGQEFTF
jgi:hypothetical protein